MRLEMSVAKDKIKKVQRKIWQIVGIRDYNINRVDLWSVIDKLKKIDQIPEGYHYPELNRRDYIPRDL